MEGITQGELSKIQHLEKSSLSRNLKRLLSNKLIEKEVTKGLRLTNNGKALLEKLLPAWEDAKAEVQGLLGTEGQQAMDIIVNKLTP